MLHITSPTKNKYSISNKQYGVWQLEFRERTNLAITKNKHQKLPLLLDNKVTQKTRSRAHPATPTKNIIFVQSATIERTSQNPKALSTADENTNRTKIILSANSESTNQSPKALSANNESTNQPQKVLSTNNESINKSKRTHSAIDGSTKQPKKVLSASFTTKKITKP